MLDTNPKDSLEISRSLYQLFLLFQVIDFLSGKAPLNLTMRLGDHMMLIQLQLSTVNSSSSRRAAAAAAAAASRSTAAAAAAPGTPNANLLRQAASATAPPRMASNPPRQSSTQQQQQQQTRSSSGSSSGSSASSSSSYRPRLDTRALAEASKNLTQTLKQLSSEVLTTKADEVRISKVLQDNIYRNFLKAPPSTATYDVENEQ